MKLCVTAAAALLAACGTRGGPAPGVLQPEPSDTAFVRLEGGDFVTTWGESLHVEPFEIGRDEVTCRLYVYLASKAHLDLPPDPRYPGSEPFFDANPDLPAVNMSATEADSAAGTIGCRLPTAAEWEYAASRGLSGPTGPQYPWGTLPPEDASNPANYMAGDDWDSRNADGYLYLAPVGSFPLSSAGLADLAGNVAEWTRPQGGMCRVYGGAWDSPSEGLRIGAWRELPPGDRARHIGFRLAR